MFFSSPKGVVFLKVAMSYRIMNLKDRLLANYVKNTDSHDALVQEIFENNEKPYYEFGKLCGARHARNPAKLLDDQEMARIGKKIHGEYWRRQGERFFEESCMMKGFAGWQVPAEKVSELAKGMAADYAAAIADFNRGYGQGAMEAVRNSWFYLLDLGIEAANSPLRCAGVEMPMINNYPDMFEQQMEKRNIDFMIWVYGLQGRKIGEKFPDAGKLVGFLRAIKEK
jgi:hypothetical protein